jgi:threonine dehydratase
MLDAYLKRILVARVYEVATETSLDYAPALSRRFDNSIWLKREDEQPVFSFKLRGAYNKMVSLPTDALKRGVVASSAGNHAQGVALSAQKLGAKAVIVMPVTTPPIKVDAVRALGAEVILHGDNYDAAFEHASKLEMERGLTFIHPYDDPDVIAGQGTVGIEILKQHPEPIDAIFVAVGGGGLIAGVGVAVKTLRPDIKVIGVEPEDADAMDRSLREGRRVRLDTVGRFADGVAVRQVGEETFRIAREVVDDMIIVSNDEICAAMKDIFEDRRCVLEPAGALAFAGLKRYIERDEIFGQCLISIACGANINFDSLRHVSERAEIGEHREAIIVVEIPEHPGSFREFCLMIGDYEITELNYRFDGKKKGHVFLGIKTIDLCDGDVLTERLKDKGYVALNQTENELAKVHIRHLVGGRAECANGERYYQFAFPERKGALGDFLTRMRQPWNITLFHYRNHGSDFGRVLVGVQVPKSDVHAFQMFLEDLGYEYTDETDNPACQLFLA